MKSVQLLGREVPLKCSAFTTIIYEEEFRALGAQVKVVTVDGSHGEKGFVTDHLPETITSYYT